MLLETKIAVIYRAGGAVGGAVGRASASEGASLFLTGLHLSPVEVVDWQVSGRSADQPAFWCDGSFTGGHGSVEEKAKDHRISRCRFGHSLFDLLVEAHKMTQVSTWWQQHNKY